MGLTNNKRGIGRYVANKTIKDSYKEFKADHPEIPYTLYRDIYETFIQENDLDENKFPPAIGIKIRTINSSSVGMAKLYFHLKK